MLEDARVERDPEKNTVRVALNGVVGPKARVAILNYEMSERLGANYCLSNAKAVSATLR